MPVNIDSFPGDAGLFVNGKLIHSTESGLGSSLVAMAGNLADAIDAEVTTTHVSPYDYWRWHEIEEMLVGGEVLFTREKYTFECIGVDNEGNQLELTYTQRGISKREALFELLKMAASNNSDVLPLLGARCETGEALPARFLDIDNGIAYMSGAGPVQEPHNIDNQYFSVVIGNILVQIKREHEGVAVELLSTIDNDETDFLASTYAYYTEAAGA